MGDVLSVNLRGPWLLSRQFARKIIEKSAQHGPQESEANSAMPSIVNISSIVAKTGTVGAASYAASKAGLVGLTKSSAKELAKHNIRCNAIQPGFIETPMARAV